MKDLKGSKTYDNLLIAFAGESQARNKYTFFASKARAEGYMQIAGIFEETAANEKEHAELWYKHFAGVGTTEENLLNAAEGEHYEWSEMYADMAKVARDEGFSEIAEQMEGVAAIEKYHEERYLKFRENIIEGRVFARDEEHVWVCSNCGHHHRGTSAPDICPVCFHDRGYFKIQENNL
ncbi:MAG TPA: rubrerythrin family protein [Candidatus Copromorpha excrementigallinarum]|uniref:Rubrerythrin family protein n=1 Tax=Candidatus Allocopromorpha excrementigallinarum TaxID=2840742 RepID=A0A9D1L7J7_9FIRM|nr:rubrerythrin family protein [Candidatus Copromorpha excrementigallinarum]